MFSSKTLRDSIPVPSLAPCSSTFDGESSEIKTYWTKNSYFGATAIVAGWGVTETRMIRGSPVKVRALPDRAKHVEVKVKKCEVGGARAEFDYPVGVLCASDRSEWMI